MFLTKTAWQQATTIQNSILKAEFHSYPMKLTILTKMIIYMMYATLTSDRRKPKQIDRQINIKHQIYMADYKRK